MILRCCFCAALVAGRVEGADAPALPSKPVVRQVSPGVYEVGKVRLDQKAMSISFAGTLNMKRGLLEYLVVHSKGSVHESLLVTEVEATDIHVAMLLLGAKGGAVVAEAPPAQLDARYFRTAPKLMGDAVLIRVKWKEKDVEKSASIEDWLFRESVKQPVEHGAWTYNGSMVHEGRFLAQTEGNLVALVTSPSALINNPRQGHDNDHLWNVNGDTTPGIGTPVEIVIQLVPSSTSSSSKTERK
ncbi:MAG: hypothetical protein JNM99_20920 [Verrucomicrobiaceae bacterium]|nr:hypothetical protein [Verrucomicrobiaceae bacterium]